MGTIVDVSYNTEMETFLLNPTDEQFKFELLQVQDGNQYYMNEWYSLVGNFTTLSKSIAQTLPDKSLSLVNPYNPENNLLVIMNETIIL